MTFLAILAAQAALQAQIQACSIIHNWRGKCVAWAPHPAARIAPEEWVDAVVEAAR